MNYLCYKEGGDCIEYESKYFYLSLAAILSYNIPFKINAVI